MKNILFLSLFLFFYGCSSSTNIVTDTNADINTESSPVNLSGILADKSISITEGFCKILNTPSDSFVIIAGRNLAYPEGIWLTSHPNKKEIYSLSLLAASLGKKIRINCTAIDNYPTYYNVVHAMLHF
ncbi:MAG: hypothetical protein A3I09_04905 [Deltaproteobacteria bacterium RIFCSPLOWO2_02_FULL_47_10]|nr:MAG: hypothetical protein A3I09_04905 [Deltaproteobacteria bacterium RIFCSPLOWO2_02_FULL_47_10]